LYITDSKIKREHLLGGVVVRASHLLSTGCEYDSWPYTAGLVLGWATVCGWVNHLGM